MSQQTSRKTGVKSSAQKAANTRHGTQPMPAAQPEPGAFGKGLVEKASSSRSENRSSNRQQETRGAVLETGDKKNKK